MATYKLPQFTNYKKKLKFQPLILSSPYKIHLLKMQISENTFLLHIQIDIRRTSIPNFKFVCFVVFEMY